MSLLHPKIFEYGPGKKFRARADTSHWNGLRIEFRQPWGWEAVTAPDVLEAVMKVLGRAAIGFPVENFKWTLDDRYTEADLRPAIFRK